MRFWNAEDLGPCWSLSTRSLIMVARGYRTKSRKMKANPVFFFLQVRCFEDTRLRLIKFVINKLSLGLNILTTSNRKKKIIKWALFRSAVMCVVCYNAHIRWTGCLLLGSKLPLLRKKYIIIFIQIIYFTFSTLIIISIKIVSQTNPKYT